MIPHIKTVPSGAQYPCTCPIATDHQVSNDLVIWTIYRSPTDFPTVPFVLRSWLVAGPQLVDAGALGFADTLDEARRMLPAELVRFEPSPGDDPVIVESWI